MHLTSPHSSQLLERVREGMTVMDANGEKIGKVDFVKMGDPDAATTQGQQIGGGATATAVPSVLAAPAAFAAGSVAGSGEPKVPEPRRSHLLRVGYMRVDRSGLFSGETYFAADEIASVDGDTIWMLPEGAHTSTSAPTTASTPSVAGAESRQRITVTPTAHTDTTTRTMPRAEPTSVRPMAAETLPHVREERGWPMGRTIGGAALLGLLLGGGAGVMRWQRERNRPINRLRRRAQALGKRLPDTSAISDRMPDVDRRIGGGLGAALAGLALAWILRSRGEEAAEEAKPTVVWEQVPVSTTNLAPMWWGLLGATLTSVVAAILWRRPRERKQPVYIGTPGVESALGRDRTRTGELPREMGMESPRS